MIIRGSLLLPILFSTLALSSQSVSAYFAQVNNVHVEFAASGTVSAAVESAAEATLAESAEAAESVPSLEVVSPQIIELFESWIMKFEKVYESLEEKTKRMLVWLENHGAFHCMTFLIPGPVSRGRACNDFHF